ncbi:hypothetical protein B0T21DRAFT_121346 [Apiosordaria backusii]|uniref:Uncharacterized protein n=1 Tax=Apiosordaria backusii TaxID=314023 RepID=A0AA40EM44_9PEZI|nr:hypothetical protein B0T21DRAFT_121346 [Apiosordaria backusii]
MLINGLFGATVIPRPRNGDVADWLPVSRPSSFRAPGPDRGGFPVGWLEMGRSRLGRRARRRRSETGDGPHLTIANPRTASLLDGDRSTSLSLTGLVCDLASAILEFQAGIPLELAHWHWGPFLLETVDTGPLPAPSLPICRPMVAGHSPPTSLDPDPLGPFRVNRGTCACLALAVWLEAELPYHCRALTGKLELGSTILICLIGFEISFTVGCCFWKTGDVIAIQGKCQKGQCFLIVETWRRRMTER